MKTETRNVWIYAISIVIALVFIGTVYLETTPKNSSPTKALTNILAQESDAQAKCRVSTKKAFDRWSGKLAKLAESSYTNNDISVTASTADYKYNYNTDVSLCFMEYMFSWKLRRAGNEGQFDAKFVLALFSDTTDPTTSDSTALATLVKFTYPSGSQQNRCTVLLPGHYDDPTQMPIKDMVNPTQCNSGSEFDSLVMERFGIK